MKVKNEMSNLSIIKKSFSIIILLLTLAYTSKSEVQLIRINSQDSNRVILYFSAIPSNYKSELSQDKKKVTIKLTNCIPVETARKAIGKGIIESIYASQLNTNIEISIILKDKMGYTANILPYSKAINVEFFRWNELKSVDDYYRSGLLALESGLQEVAIKNLSAAHSLGNHNASAYLGFIYLSKGQINKAKDYLRISALKNVNIDDIYAGISQILKIENNFEKATQFADIFKKRSGLNHYLDLPIENLSDTTLSSDNIASNENYFDDIIALVNSIDTVKTDTIHPQFANLFSQDTTKTAIESEKQTELIPSWITMLIVALLGFALALVLITTFLYLRWRKKQAQKISSKERKTSFDDNLQKSMNTTNVYSRKATSLYSQNEKSANESEEIKNNETKSTDTKNELQSKLFDTLDKLSQKHNESETNQQEPAKVGHSPKLELAMHLQKEQQKLKQRNIDSLSQTKLPTDVKKMTEFAKKLGIEKGSLEVKKALDDIMSNKDYMKKLSEKFK